VLKARAEGLLRAGHVDDAVGAYRELLSVAPHLADSWYNLGYALQVTARFADAVEAYDKAIGLGIGRPEEVRRNKALILADHLARPEAAEAELREAVRACEEFVPGWVDLGRLAEQLGKRGEARSAYEKALSLDPSHALALAHLANVQKVEREDDPLLDRLRRAMASPGRSHADLASLGFALGKALDGVGAYDDAFHAYAQGNHEARLSAGPGWRGYDRTAWEAWVQRLPALFETRNPASTPVTPAAKTCPQLIFICGMFRSGSTLVETILSGHPEVTAGGELDLIPRISRELWAKVRAGADPNDDRLLGAARRQYLESVRALFPEARVLTDKRPDNFLHVGLIKRLFPEAKIVHTRRDPLDTCLSVFFTHFDTSQAYAFDLLDIAHWYRLYEGLMSAWRTKHGSDIIDANYEALVADPERQIEEILRFVKLDWDDACLNFHEAKRSVQTPSVWQVRQPLYTSSRERWKRYRAHLGPLAAALGRRI
jgi:tetratricopeptide (TPR) repeat protein